MKKILFLLVALLIAVPELHAAGNKIKDQVSDASEKLAQTYRKNRVINFKKAVAILDFENLTPAAKKNGLGETVAELFAAEFSQSTLFRVIERKNLGKVLDEQALQLTGATEGTSAVQAGKLLDAQALLYGSVTESGDNFIVTVKLTDVETGEVIAQTITVPKEDLIETREYLLDMSYVKKMGIGITLSAMGHTVCGDSSTFSPVIAFEDTGINRQFGFEIRYRFTNWFMIGAGYNMIWGQVAYVPDQVWNFGAVSTGYTPNGVAPFVIDVKGYDIPLMFYFNYTATRRLNLFAGAGVAYENLTLLGYFDDGTTGGGCGFGVNQYGPQLQEEILVTMFRAGVEFFVTPRMALSLTCGYDMAKMEPDFANQRHLIDLEKNVGSELDMSGFYYGTSVSFYF